MHSYIAFIWNHTDLTAQKQAASLIAKFRQSAQDWQQQLSCDGIAVFVEPLAQPDFRAYVLPKNAGVVLGALFSTSSASTDLRFDDRIGERICASRGVHFTQEYWGGYVAFFTDHANQRTMVARDCSGKIPCYWTDQNRVKVVFSNVSDLQSKSAIRFSVNWQYIAAFIYYEQLQTRESGLNEITEVLAGDVVEFSSGATEQRILWDPSSIATDVIFEPPDRAAHLLRQTTQHCINQWASLYDSIIHNLSGGLDSSIVLGCLARSPHKPKVTCLNRFTELAAEDERRFARLAAGDASVELVERHWQAGSRLLDARLFDFPVTEKPSMSVLATSLDVEERNALAHLVRAQSAWTGQGGDHIFVADRSSHGAIDYVLLRGLRSGIGTAIADSSRLTRDSYWSVARSSLAALLRRPTWTPEHLHAHIAPFANPEALPENPFSYVRNPWSLQTDHLPFGKQFQIFYLAEVMNRHRPTATLEAAAEHHPLLSQPLVELCLRLPTYTLLTGGRARGLARQAFDQYVPLPILKRETKGSTAGYWQQVVTRSSSFLRELLCDGLLARQRIIDPLRVDALLKEPERSPYVDLMRLFAAASAEVWVRSWNAERKRAAA